MLTVVSYQFGEVQYVRVEIAQHTDYFQFNNSHLEPVHGCPTLLGRPILECKLSLTAQDDPSELIKTRIINHYQQRANAYRAIWQKLGGAPPTDPEDVLSQFSDWLTTQQHRKEVDVSGCSLARTGVEFLLQFESLETLKLRNCHMKQIQLDILIGHPRNPCFTRLKYLDVSDNNKITSIPYHPKLKTLIMDQTAVRDCSKAYQTHSHKLQTLSLINTPLPPLRELSHTAYDEEDEDFKEKKPWEWVVDDWIKLSTIENVKGFKVT